MAFGMGSSTMMRSYGSLGSLSSILPGSSSQPGRITRKNLAEQLREYQLRKNHDWSSSQFFGRTSRASAPRTSLWLFFIGVLLVAAVVALCLGYFALAWLYIALAVLVAVALMVSFRVHKKPRRQRRLLP